MKSLLLTLFLTISMIGFSQEDSKSTSEIKGITQEIRFKLIKCVGLDCTMIKSSKSFSLEGKNVAGFSHFIDVKIPKSILTRPDGFISFMDSSGDVIDVKFYFAEGETSYMEFLVGDHQYYNCLTQQGADFFKQFKE